VSANLERVVDQLLKVAQAAGQRRQPPSERDLGDVLVGFASDLQLDSTDPEELGSLLLDAISRQQEPLRGQAQVILGVQQSEEAYTTRSRSLWGASAGGPVIFARNAFVLSQILVDIALLKRDRHREVSGTISGYRLLTVDLSYVVRQAAEPTDWGERRGTVRIKMDLCCEAPDALVLAVPIPSTVEFRTVSVQQYNTGTGRWLANVRRDVNTPWPGYAIRTSTYAGEGQCLLLVPLNSIPPMRALIGVQVEADLPASTEEFPLGDEMTWTITRARESVTLTMAFEPERFRPGRPADPGLFRIDEPSNPSVVRRRMRPVESTEEAYKNMKILQASTRDVHPPGTRVRLGDGLSIDFY
jgi:hypothetical protein